jgi:hypothetical protein
MMLDQMHPEDIKAVIRKRYGTVSQFVRAKDLPDNAVSDMFRGRVSRRVRDAVEEVLQENAESIDLDDSKAVPAAHRLNAGAR